MGGFRDYYDLLNVSPDADEAAITQAYRRECFRWHPDRNQRNSEEAHERFLVLGEAYTVLSDADARARYDKLWKALHDEPEPAPKDSGRPRDRFDEILSEACRSRYDAAADWDRQSSVERQVLDVMRELAAPHLGRKRMTAGSIAVRGFVFLAASAGAYSAALTFALTSADWFSYVLAAVPVAAAGVFVSACFQSARDRRTVRSFRPVAERIVRLRSGALTD